MNYYDGSIILSKKDINNGKPGMYIVCGNRTSGKTTFFNSWAWKKVEEGEFRKIAYVVRYKYELEDCCEQFFEPLTNKGIKVKYEKGKVFDRGYSEIIGNERLIGYGVAISSSDKLKKVSNLFNDVDLILWDEFQSFKFDYLKDEMKLFRELIKSICRGDGEFFRYVPCVCISNAISLLCPLLSSTDIPYRVQRNTKFLRGDGYVFEQNMNMEAQDAISKNPIIRALGGEELLTELKYSSDSHLAVGWKPRGRGVYLMTLMYGEDFFSLKRYEYGSGNEIYYVSEQIDKSFKQRYTVEENRVSGTWIIPPSIEMLRRAYKDGKMRFSNLNARRAAIEFIKY